jgi:hypothetical protein
MVGVSLAPDAARLVDAQRGYNYSKMGWFKYLQKYDTYHLNVPHSHLKSKLQSA